MGGQAEQIEALLRKANWQEERRALRDLLLGSGLDEAVKWGQLCYGHAGSNVAIIYCLKAYCGIGFFKGSLMPDPDGVLHAQGAHSQAVRMLRYTSLAQITAQADLIKRYISAAVAVEETGQKVDFAEKNNLVLPAELTAAFAQDSAFESAFGALTPGRQRAYVLHISAAKHSQTRSALLAKCQPRILAGKGLADR
jgi:uncharacterized protein YdeI (YjbR/CyaY-like superfamily)